MFNSVKEFAQAMLDGRKFKVPQYSTTKIVFYFHNGFKKHIVDPSREINNIAEMSILDWEEYLSLEEYTEPKWWENIPKNGILCLVWDGSGYESIGFVVNFEKDEEVFDTRDGLIFPFARPLTKEEVMQYIYEGDLT